MSEEPADAERLRTIAARDQLWANLRLLQPEIAALAEGESLDPERQRQIVLLLARIVTAELQFRADLEGNPGFP
jgi:hypothetical protein